MVDDWLKDTIFLREQSMYKRCEYQALSPPLKGSKAVPSYGAGHTDN